MIYGQISDMTDSLDNYKNTIIIPKPVYVDIKDLTDIQRDRLLTSKSFCILPGTLACIPRGSIVV